MMLKEEARIKPTHVPITLALAVINSRSLHLFAALGGMGLVHPGRVRPVRIGDQAEFHIGVWRGSTYCFFELVAKGFVVQEYVGIVEVFIKA